MATRLFESLFYRMLSPVVRLGVAVFFRRVEVRGRENVPSEPVIVGANHPNMFLDPLLMGAALYPRQVHFLAKAPLFRVPVAGTMLRWMGVLPVYRKQDFPEKMDQNQAMFEACVGALHRGESIGIFPEGVSAAEPWLQPLKTGAARILLDAASTAPGEVTPRLLPVGLNYQHRTVFRSDVLILFGAPLDPRPYLETYAKDQREAVRQLTAALEESLKGLTRNLGRVEDERVVEHLERLYRREILPVGEDLEERFYLSRSIVDGFEYFRTHRPQKVAEVERRLETYFFGLEAFDLAGAHLAEAETYSFGRVLLFLARLLPPLVLAAPLALYGTLMGFLPYNLTDPLARRGNPGPEELATRKVLWGALLFLAFYTLQTGLVFLGWGPWVALAYLVSLIPCGLLGVWWIQRLQSLVRHGRTTWLFLWRKGFRERMARLRKELIQDLTGLSEEYLRLRENESPTEDREESREGGDGG